MVREAGKGITGYELRLPLEVLGLAAGARFGFNMAVLDDDDGKGERYWFQLAGGLVGGSDIKLYPQFVLGE